ncbi:hypothetical protein PENSPDRAFT_712657 [Peniophora sp. CONT]|nr:hypothetical protein PENSPDRAFT_712657 [Peniophora sp. CONT]
MLSNRFIQLIVCATMAPFVSVAEKPSHYGKHIAATIAYSAFPATTIPNTCLGTPISTGTFNSGTSGVPVCQELGGAASDGIFTLDSTAPAGCQLFYFSGTGCTGTEGPQLTAPLVGIPLVPGVSIGCTPLQFLLQTAGAQSVEVNCPTSTL